MTFQPAPVGRGIQFKRMDLAGHPLVEASVDLVDDTQRSTSLAKGNIKIHTVEHVLAAFSGMGVDNAIVEIDASEPPISDGSSDEFCRMIEKSGLVAQTESREIFHLVEPIELEMGDTVISAFPHRTLKITCTSSDNRGRFTEMFSLELSPETWRRELSRARTFCYFEEIATLSKSGLIRGGGLENAIIIREDAVLTNEPLRYTNEFVRHKMLDILGDLSLAGRPIAAHIIAVRPSHTANCEMARRLRAQMNRPVRLAQTFAPPEISTTPDNGNNSPNPSQSTVMNIEQVMQTLPHRYPFLMVDKVTRIDGNKITAVKNVSIGEPYFAGHFPDHPIMPGVLQLEAIAQAAGILMLKQAENAGKLAYFMAADEVKWRKPVRPGDTLVIEVELTRVRGKVGKAKGVCSVNGEEVSEALVTFSLVDSKTT